MEQLKRMMRAVAMAGGVTVGSIMPLAIFHIAAPLFAPIVGGYWAASNLRLSDGESVLLGFIVALLVGLPLPLIQQGLGFFSYLSPLSIDFFAVIFAVYTGGLVGILAWFGSANAISDVAA